MGREIPSAEDGTDYLSIDDVLQIAETVLGVPPRRSVRDIGLLMGAVDRPSLRYRNTEVYSGLPVKAAALLESLARENGLVDGNKRVAWLATNVFLELNGAAVRFRDDETFSLLMEVARGYLSTGDLAQKLADRMFPWPPISADGSG